MSKGSMPCHRSQRAELARSHPRGLVFGMSVRQLAEAISRGALYSGPVGADLGFDILAELTDVHPSAAF